MESPHSLVLKSGHHNQRDVFDNEDEFPDVKISLQGLPKPLLLHRLILADGSNMLRSLFKSTEDYGDKKEGEAWRLDKFFNKVDDVTYCNVLQKWLKYFYGFDITFELDEYCAALTSMFHLQLTNQGEVQKLQETQMEDIAKRDVDAGIVIMKGCVHYEECHSESKSRIDLKIARRIFTLSNLKKEKAKLVEFMLSLPSEYLDCIECGEPHTEFSEFELKREYLIHHEEDIGIEERRRILNKCEFSTFNSKEMKELQALNILTSEQLNDVCQKLIALMEKTLVETETKLRAETRAKQEAEAKAKAETAAKAKAKAETAAKAKAIADKQPQILQLFTQSQSSTTEIPTGDGTKKSNTTHDGGAIYDKTRKIILSVSGNFDEGRTIKITHLTDATHGTTTTQKIIPFDTHGQFPIYDGHLYTYFFESESSPSGSRTRFGRLKMDTLEFEVLSSLPSSQFLMYSGGCFHNGKIYILNKDRYLCEYNVESKTWSTLSFQLPSTGHLMSDPINSTDIYCLFENNLSRIDLTNKTITEVQKNPAKYLFNGNFEHYLLRTDYFGYFIFATFSSHWHVYSSISNIWSRLSKWKDTKDYSSHLVIVPEGPTAYYHIHESNNWEMVPLSFLSLE